VGLVTVVLYLFIEFFLSRFARLAVLETLGMTW